MLEKWKSYCGGSTLLAWLTLAEVSVWLLVTVLSLTGKLLHFEVPVARWLTLPSSFTLFLSRPWTLLTYMAVHFEVLHMLFNVLWLYWFGRILITALPERQLGILFAGGGIGGGILFMLSAAAGFGGGWLCGCSAAVIAVMCGAALQLPDFPVRLFLIGEVKLKWVAVACCVLTFLGGGGNQAAHVGGLLWGVAYFFLLRFRATHHDSESNKNTRTRRGDKMAEILHQRRTDMQRLDMLLDKIRLSGYDSLSRKERKELNELSEKVGR